MMDSGYKKGLLSVIVPVYNVEPYLRRCVDSILTQTYKNIEIILIDDGSTDKSGKICDVLADRNECISVYHQDNQGQSAARNQGMDVAVGEYIAFLDSDDYIQNNMYESLIDNMEEHKKDIAACATHYVDQQGNDVRKSKYTDAIYNISPEDMLGNMYLSKPPRSEVWNKVFRRTVIEGIRFKKGEVFEEIYFDCEVFLNSDGCVYQDSPYHNYLVKREGNTNSYFNEKKLCVFRELDYVESRLRKIGADAQADKMRAFKLSFALNLYEQAVTHHAGSDTINQLLRIAKEQIRENRDNAEAKALKKCVSVFRISPSIYIKMRGVGFFK